MSQKYNTIIIGAGTAGLTAAIYTARKSKSVLIIESTGIGGQISFSPCVENYPGFSKISGSEFSDKLYEQCLDLGVEIELETVTKIEVNKDGKKLVYSDDDTVVRECEKIIIATGVEHRKLGLQNEEQLTGHGVSYCAVCDGAFFKGKTVAVVGGGSSALQSVRLLSDICQKVFLIHRRSEFRGEQKLADELKALNNVEFILDSTVEKLNGENQLESILVKNKSDNSEKEIVINGLFIYVGQIPNNEIFRGVVDLDDGGYIVASENCRTNINGVFAAGDCRTKAVRQLTTAASDGSVAALSD